jgi:hypothetical protein
MKYYGFPIGVLSITSVMLTEAGEQGNKSCLSE